MADLANLQRIHVESYNFNHNHVFMGARWMLTLGELRLWLLGDYLRDDNQIKLYPACSCGDTRFNHTQTAWEGDDRYIACSACGAKIVELTKAGRHEFDVPKDCDAANRRELEKFLAFWIEEKVTNNFVEIVLHSRLIEELIDSYDWVGFSRAATRYQMENGYGKNSETYFKNWAFMAYEFDYLPGKIKPQGS